MYYEETLAKPQKLTPKNEELYDIAIIGAGPAGMSAALAAGRANLKVLLLEKALPGGETAVACQITNYLGFPGGINGLELARKMEDHMFNYEIHYSCEYVEDIHLKNDFEKVIKTDLGSIYKAKTVILATGLDPKKIENASAIKFLGRGVSYCAPCDAPLYKDKAVAILGGGNCACYAAELLAQYASKIYMVHNSNDLKAVKSVKNRILNNPDITMMWNSSLDTVFGIESVEKAKIINTSTNQHTWIDVKGIFVYIGRSPSKHIFNMSLKINENGYIITDEYMRTNLPGVFAAGDVRAKQIRQIATAVSDGLIASINAERFLAYNA